MGDTSEKKEGKATPPVPSPRAIRIEISAPDAHLLTALVELELTMITSSSPSIAVGALI